MPRSPLAESLRNTGQSGSASKVPGRRLSHTPRAEFHLKCNKPSEVPPDSPAVDGIRHWPPFTRPPVYSGSWVSHSTIVGRERKQSPRGYADKGNVQLASRPRSRLEPLCEPKPGLGNLKFSGYIPGISHCNGSKHCKQSKHRVTDRNNAPLAVPSKLGYLRRSLFMFHRPPPWHVT